MRIYDNSLTPEPPKVPDFKVSTVFYQVENGHDRDGLGNDENYFWKTKKETENKQGAKKVVVVSVCAKYGGVETRLSRYLRRPSVLAGGWSTWRANGKGSGWIRRYKARTWCEGKRHATTGSRLVLTRLILDL